MLGFYTVPIGNRTPGRRVAVHYTTAAPRQLPAINVKNRLNDNIDILWKIVKVNIYLFVWV